MDKESLRARVAELEQRLAQSEARRTSLLAALERVATPLEIYDADGVAEWMNPAMVEFIGIPSADIAIGKFNILTDPFSEQTGMRPLYERAYAGEVVQTPEFMIEMERASQQWHTGSHSVWFYMLLYPLRDPTGAVSGVLAIMQETTHTRRMEKTLQLAQHLEGVELLAGGVAHDFNNLLTAILGYGSMLSTGMLPLEDTPKYAAEIVHAGEQAAFLTGQLLAYAGKGQGEVVLTDMHELVRGISGLLAVTLPSGVNLTQTPHSAPATALVDVGQLKQVVMNLITNARDAIGDAPGRITVASNQRTWTEEELARFHSQPPLEPGEYVSIEVADTGCGMDGPTLERIFEPYFTTKREGHGLGLAATLGIIRTHHGGLHVQSTPGEGTHFQVLLPASTAPVEAPPSALPAPRMTRGGVALVADDEPYIRAVIRHILSGTGLQVIEASDGGQAMAAFARLEHPPALVMVDMMMPVLNGLDTLTRLRDASPTLPVVLMSAHSEVAQEAAQTDPRVWFLQKPFRARDVHALLRAVFGDLPTLQ